ncbi:MAG: hypothetical protein WC812_04785 [Candidatus Pacearchaeota archaeon]|jgi:hypothetical protein
MVKNTIEIKFTEENTKVTVDKTAVFDLGHVEQIELDYPFYGEKIKSISFRYKDPTVLEKNKEKLDELTKITESGGSPMGPDIATSDYKCIYCLGFNKDENISIQFE